MKTPAFWYRRSLSPLGFLLAPIGGVYGWATQQRLATGQSVDPGAPVICVGNLTAGGAGKTPVVRDIGHRLKAAGRRPHIISKGYGRKQADSGAFQPVRVDPELHIASQMGDEPLMLAGDFPVWVHQNRAEAARFAVEAGADVILTDDGFQDPALQKTLSFVVVDGELGFGNEGLIPSGPLREPIAVGLARASAVVIVGEDKYGVAEKTRQFDADLPVLSCQIEPGDEKESLGSGPVHAFAGIAHPEKFFNTLASIGCDLPLCSQFADHHAYSNTEISRMKARARAAGMRLVTTEKDWMRLSPEQRVGIEVLTITLDWENEAALNTILDRAHS